MTVIRWIGAVVALVLAALLVAVTPVALFARNQVFDGDRYVATVALMAGSPEIQAAVADRLTDEIVGLIDVPGLTQQLVDALDRPRLEALVGTLGGVMDGSVESLVAHETERFVQSQQFETLWTETNRIAHGVVERMLTTGEGTDTVTVDLGRLLDAVKQRLLDKGFTAAERIPQKSIPFTVTEVPGLADARQYVRWLHAAATWLPWVALVLLVIGLLLAPKRLKAAAGFAMATVVLLTVLLVGARMERGRLRGEAAMDAFDIVFRNLIITLRVMLAIAVVAAFGLLWAAYHHRSEKPVV